MYLSKGECTILDKMMKHGAWSRRSLKGDGHLERMFIKKKIFNLSLKQRQRQRCKFLPGQKTAWEEAEEKKAIHGLLNVAR